MQGHWEIMMVNTEYVNVDESQINERVFVWAIQLWALFVFL